MDKLFKRGLRQLRLNVHVRPHKKYEPIDRVKIREKVQSLHAFDENDLDELGTVSKFNMEAFKSDVPRSEKVVSVVNDFEIASVIKFISESCTSDNLKLYTPLQDDPERVSQLVLSLPSSPARRALLQSFLTNFKPLFPKRRITVDGDSDKKSDWIVVDLKTVFVHIFDPQTRLEVDLDGKLEMEYNARPDDSLPTFIGNLSKSLPRSIASRPNFIEKYIKNKQQQ